MSGLIAPDLPLTMRETFRIPIAETKRVEPDDELEFGWTSPYIVLSGVPFKWMVVRDVEELGFESMTFALQCFCDSRAHFMINTDASWQIRNRLEDGNDIASKQVINYTPSLTKHVFTKFINYEELETRENGYIDEAGFIDVLFEMEIRDAMSAMYRSPGLGRPREWSDLKIVFDNNVIYVSQNVFAIRCKNALNILRPVRNGVVHLTGTVDSAHFLVFVNVLHMDYHDINAYNIWHLLTYARLFGSDFALHHLERYLLRTKNVHALRKLSLAQEFDLRVLMDTIIKSIDSAEKYDRYKNHPLFVELPEERKQEVERRVGENEEPMAPFDRFTINGVVYTAEHHYMTVGRPTIWKRMNGAEWQCSVDNKKTTEGDGYEFRLECRKAMCEFWQGEVGILVEKMALDEDEDDEIVTFRRYIDSNTPNAIIWSPEHVEDLNEQRGFLFRFLIKDFRTTFVPTLRQTFYTRTIFSNAQLFIDNTVLYVNRELLMGQSRFFEHLFKSSRDVGTTRRFRLPDDITAPEFEMFLQCLCHNDREMPGLFLQTKMEPLCTGRLREEIGYSITQSDINDLAQLKVGEWFMARNAIFAVVRRYYTPADAAARYIRNRGVEWYAYAHFPPVNQEANNPHQIAYYVATRTKRVADGEVRGGELEPVNEQMFMEDLLLLAGPVDPNVRLDRGYRMNRQNARLPLGRDRRNPDAHRRENVPIENGIPRAQLDVLRRMAAQQDRLVRGDGVNNGRAGGGVQNNGRADGGAQNNGRARRRQNYRPIINFQQLFNMAAQLEGGLGYIFANGVVDERAMAIPRNQIVIDQIIRLFTAMRHAQQMPPQMPLEGHWMIDRPEFLPMLPLIPQMPQQVVPPMAPYRAPPMAPHRRPQMAAQIAAPMDPQMDPHIAPRRRPQGPAQRAQPIARQMQMDRPIAHPMRQQIPQPIARPMAHQMDPHRRPQMPQQMPPPMDPQVPPQRAQPMADPMPPLMPHRIPLLMAPHMRPQMAQQIDPQIALPMDPQAPPQMAQPMPDQIVLPMAPQMQMDPPMVPQMAQQMPNQMAPEMYPLMLQQMAPPMPPQMQMDPPMPPQMQMDPPMPPQVAPQMDIEPPMIPQLPQQMPAQMPVDPLMPPQQAPPHEEEPDAQPAPLMEDQNDDEEDQSEDEDEAEQSEDEDDDDQQDVAILARIPAYPRPDARQAALLNLDQAWRRLNHIVYEPVQRQRPGPRARQLLPEEQAPAPLQAPADQPPVLQDPQQLPQEVPAQAEILHPVPLNEERAFMDEPLQNHQH